MLNFNNDLFEFEIEYVVENTQVVMIRLEYDMFYFLLTFQNNRGRWELANILNPRANSKQFRTRNDFKKRDWVSEVLRQHKGDLEQFVLERSKYRLNFMLNIFE